MRTNLALVSVVFLLGSLWNASIVMADPFEIREMTGTIESIRFSDPLLPSNILGEADVKDGLGKKMTVKITLDTSIRDPNWHSAYVSYLIKGKKIKLRYKIDREGVCVAQDIHVIKD